MHYDFVYGLGDSRWKTSKKHAKAGTFPKHGLKGKMGKDSNRRSCQILQAEASLDAFLTKIAQRTSDVPVTNDEVVELPSNCSKRGLFKQWCQENGYPECKPTCSWGHFCSYWNKKFPNLKVGTEVSRSGGAGEQVN